MKIHCDFETRSAVDLKKAGVHRYAEDPSTEILTLSYRLDDGPTKRWRPGDELPWPGAVPMLAAHNAGFERAIWNAKMPTHEKIKPSGQDCTLARAAALALPLSLDQLAQVLKAPVQKDKDGYRLMMKMCKPRTLEPLTWWESPDDIERLQAYCDTDVLTECAVDKILPPLSPDERRVWELDQQINDRGFAVDVALCRRADLVAAEIRRRADREIWRLTNGAVQRCTETAKIVAWLDAQGIPCTSIAKGEIEDLVVCAKLQGDSVAERVLRLRRSAARTSTAKFGASLSTVCLDGRVRGSLAYHGASTGRWAGRGVQPQNYPRVDPERDLDAVLATLDALDWDVPAGDTVDYLEATIASPMESLSKCLRATIIAPPGKKLVGGDLSNIEGRVAAWLAGEAWKLQAFRDYDAGIGPDLYRVTAARITGKPIEAITSQERQGQGKVPELACQFQGSVGAFVTMAANYGTTIDELVEVALRTATYEDIDKANDQWTPAMSRGLPKEIWSPIKTIVNGWRDANPNIVSAWWELQDAAIEAVGMPGSRVSSLGGRVQYLAARGFLWCQLPSQRVLAYAAPRLVWSRIEHEDGTVTHKRQVEFDGVNGVTKRWEPHRLYGGLQFENIVQGVARDIIVEGMFNVEAAGYPIVLTVHDEILSEVDEGFGSPRDYENLLTRLSSTYAGLPVSAKAWEDTKWVK